MSTSDTPSRREVVDRAARAVKPIAALAALCDELDKFDNLERSIGEAEAQLASVRSAIASEQTEAKRLDDERRTGLAEMIRGAEATAAAIKREGVDALAAAKAAAAGVEQEARERAKTMLAEAGTKVEALRGEAQTLESSINEANKLLEGLNQHASEARQLIDTAARVKAALA